MKPLVLCMPGNAEMGICLTEDLDGEIGTCEIRHFPDGESYVRIDSEVTNREVVIICTLNQPDNKLLPLFFLAQTARELGASRVGLVAPYLAYMRQDRQFNKGEAVTSRQFAHLISGPVDWLVTIDPHLHRIHDLNDIYPVESLTLHAAPMISQWIQQEIKNPLLVGPDEESEQWVAAVASEAAAPHIVLQKTRKGDKEVEVSVPDVDQWRACTPVLVDDIISTAHTMIETIDHLREEGMGAPVCIGVHGVFAGTAFHDLQEAGASRIVTSNTIPHETGVIDVSGLLLEGIRQILPKS